MMAPAARTINPTRAFPVVQPVWFVEGGTRWAMMEGIHHGCCDISIVHQEVHPQRDRDEHCQGNQDAQNPFPISLHYFFAPYLKYTRMIKHDYENYVKI